ncbi:MAG: transglutaminase family protein [Dehalococcoidia bacterium]
MNPGDAIAPRLKALDVQAIDWRRLSRATYLMHQRFTYQYPAPIRDLRHQLMVVPPATFGDQERSVYSLNISEPGEVITRLDALANTVIDVHIPHVEHGIVFDAWVTLDRRGQPAPRSVPIGWLSDPRFLEPTERTRPDAAIAAAAGEIEASGATGLDLAKLVNSWVHGRMEYEPGVTGVHTSAATALAQGRGVCQDYSHVAIALCRLLKLPALYVSGHLLGEGATHSWVEVLLPAADGSDEAEGWSLDPTHGRSTDLTYLTVAVGRDYGDVAPTSGSYRAGHDGTLTAFKEVRVVEVSYAD